ncbi:LysR family transcriptional regulator [Pseudidiomarina taiwanensis]|uniref:LysR family transcriptional regulator n=1 Tax=Pseudidiomarina taiwanensis TaxID=337250 RepID=A0A432ZFP2_9GAMM|nr:LysR family transcriptional regulator [Pseudidiomarina taiwanensis]RUO76741.1 LysR family transcriptional regulator [Pseudidiomarina taiwanensis]
MSRLNYHHLYYFWRVAKLGHLTQAADELAVSQSALSAQIKQLEHSMGAQLFRREGRRLVLTELGQDTLLYAEDIFQRGAELERMLKQGGERAQTLRIGMLASMSRNFIEGFIDPILHRHDHTYQLYARSQTELLQSLSHHQLDLVLTNLDVASEQAGLWQTQLLARQHVSVVAPAEFEQLDDIRLAAERHPWVVPAQTSALRPAFDSYCAQQQIEPFITAEADDMAMLRLLARDSKALAVLPAVVVRDELRQNLLQRWFDLPKVYENFYAVTLPRQRPHPLIRELLEPYTRV